MFYKIENKKISIGTELDHDLVHIGEDITDESRYFVNDSGVPELFRTKALEDSLSKYDKIISLDYEKRLYDGVLGDVSKELMFVLEKRRSSVLELLNSFELYISDKIKIIKENSNGNL